MDITQIRLKNARMLEDHVGGRGKLSEQTGINYAQFTAYIGKNPTRNIGERLARKIESGLKLEPQWLDRNHDDFNADISKKNVSFLSFLDLKSSSVQGSIILNQEIDKMYLREKDIEEIGINPELACFAEIEGNYMEPTIKDKSAVVIDLQKKEIESGKAYLIKYGKTFMIRRIYEEPGDTLRIACDNPHVKLEKPDIFMNKDQISGSLEILGRIVVVTTRT